MKKLTAILLALTLVFAFVACGDTTPADDTNKVYNIGIVQLVQHDALDQATLGFKDALVDKLGDNVKFDTQNASGDAATCTTIVDKFVNANVDLIMANATPAVIAAKEATDTIPVVGTSVTDYASSGLVNSNEAPGGNITGASDMNAVANQLELVKAFAPDAKVIGIVYCSGEENSKIQADEAKGVFEGEGYTVNLYTAADVTDLQTVVDKAVSECDVLYEPTDNLIAANMEIVKNAAAPAGVPVICGEESMCKAGGLASYSLSYYDLGFEAGLMAYEILVNGANPAEMPIKIFGASELTLIVNEEVMTEMNITLPASLAK
ncbi:MAG: ABC transporter substrate-binding protein [Clostridia bacterium]|nr:ABC transporter substrate-binding protein [Clostridia bacterium]MBQ6613924.1 ABC transporter substrate-binding protein [Clostridia bacterium]